MVLLIEVPRAISTAEDGSGLEHFRSVGHRTYIYVDGKEMRGKLQSVYYIPDIRHRLIFVDKLFSQCSEPPLNRNGLSLDDTKAPTFER